MLRIRTLSSIIALSSLFSVGYSFASDIDKHTIPASMCSPSSAQDRQKLNLYSNGWQFASSATGYVTLYCPLPLNKFGGNNTSTAKDIHNYRVFYRDSDGTGSNSRIYTYFNERGISGSVNWSGFWNSNSHNVTNHTTAVKTMNKNLSWNRLNGFFVRMYRSNTTQYPVFGGIDFNYFYII